MLIRILGAAVAILVAVSAPAQTKPLPVDPAEAKAELQRRAAEELKSNPVPVRVSRIDISKLKGDREPAPTQITIAPADRDLPPEELRAKYKSRLGSAYVKYVSVCAPAVIPPGKSGVLTITMLLGQDAAMPPSGASSIELPHSQGALTLGEPRFRPAPPARIAPALLGKPFYDDYAILDIPVTVRAGAPSGPQPVDISLEYELYNGTTGGWIERFVDHLEFDVPVGDAGAPPTPAERVVEAAPHAPAADPDERVGGAAEAAGLGASDPAAADQVGVLEDSNGTLWLLAGGVLVLIVALALRRRRG